MNHNLQNNMFSEGYKLFGQQTRDLVKVPCLSPRRLKVAALLPVVVGIVVLLVTWWFRKMNFSLFVRMIPGVLTIATAVILFYIGFVNIRGFEGAAYGILAFFLMIFAIASFVMAKARK